MPWATDFGSGISRLRRQKNTDVLSELARVYVRDALKEWVPEVEVLDVLAKREGDQLCLDVRYRVSRDGETENFASLYL